MKNKRNYNLLGFMKFLVKSLRNFDGRHQFRSGNEWENQQQSDEMVAMENGNNFK